MMVLQARSKLGLLGRNYPSIQINKTGNVRIT